MTTQRDLPFLVDLAFAAGADYTRTFVWEVSPVPIPTPTNPVTVVDLTGYTAEAIIYQEPTDVTALVTLTTTASPAGEIVLGGVNGTVALVLTHVTTASLPSTPLRWTLRVTAPDATQTVLLQGTVTRGPSGPLF